MPQLVLIVLVAVAVLMFKHAVADFYLQSTYQYLNKGHYGHPGGILHSAIHVALTPLVYLVIAPASLLLVLGIAIKRVCAPLSYRLAERADDPPQRLDRAGPMLLVRARHRPALARPELSRDRRRAYRVCGVSGADEPRAAPRSRDWRIRACRTRA